MSYTFKTDTDEGTFILTAEGDEATVTLFLSMSEAVSLFETLERDLGSYVFEMRAAKTDHVSPAAVRTLYSEEGWNWIEEWPDPISPKSLTQKDLTEAARREAEWARAQTNPQDYEDLHRGGCP